MIRVAIILVMALMSGAVRAEDEVMRVRAELSVHTLNVAQQTMLHVVCEVAQGWTLVDHPFDSLGVDDSLGLLLVASSPRSMPTRFDSGWTTFTWMIELTPDMPETGQIPALRFKAELIEGDRSAIKRTAPIPVVVESLLAAENPDWDPTALRPALEPLPERAESNVALVVSLGVFVIVGAGAIALTLVERQRRDPERARTRRLDSYQSDVQAIDTQAPMVEAASAAQTAVRKAMAECAGPRALAVTGEGLGPLLRRDIGLSPTDAALVCDFFSRVDSVLYADEATGPEQAASLRDGAMRALKSVRLASEGGGHG